MKYVPNVEPAIRLIPAGDRDGALKALAEDPSIEVVVCEDKGLDPFTLFKDICKNPSFTESFILTTEDTDITKPVRAFEHRIDFFIFRSSIVTGFYMDLAHKIVLSCERRRLALNRLRDTARKDSVIKLTSLRDHPFSEALNYALESSVDLTDSQVGYVATYTSSTRKLNIIAWSVHAMGQCRMINRPMEYDLDSSGLWGEPIRLMKTVIIDDYSTSNVYKKNGLPEGHIQLKNVLMVPVIRNGIPVATAGVANKDGEYTDEDAAQLQMLMDSMISIYQEKLFKEETRDKETLLGAILNSSPYGIIFLDRDMRIKACSKAAELILGVDDRLGLTGSIKDFLSNEVAKKIAFLVADAFSSNESRNSFVDLKDSMSRGRFNISVDLMMDPEGVAESCLVSIMDLSELSVRGGDDAALPGSRAIINGIIDRIQSFRDSVGSVCSSDSIDYGPVDEVLDYLSANAGSEFTAPSWLRLSSCIPRSIPELSVEADVGPVNLLVDRSFPHVFELLERFSVDSGARSAEVGIVLRNGALEVVYTDDGEGVPDSMKQAFVDGGIGLGMWVETVRSIVGSSGLTISEKGRFGEGTRVEMIVPSNRFFIGKMRVRRLVVRPRVYNPSNRSLEENGTIRRVGNKRI